MKPRLTTYSTWKKYLLPNNKTYIILLGNALIIIFSLLEPIFFGKLVDQCLISKDYTNFYEILLIIAFCFIVGTTVSYFVNYSIMELHFNAEINLNIDVIKYVQKLPLSFFNNKDIIYLSTRIYQDADIIVGFILENLVTVTVNFVTSLLILSIIFFKSHFLGLCLTVALILYISIYKLLNGYLYESTYAQKESQNTFFSKLTYLLSNVRFVKANSVADYLNSDVENAKLSVIAKIVKLAKVTWCFTTGCESVKYIFLIFYIYYAGLDVLNSIMPIGEFIVILNFATWFFDNTNQILTSVKSWKEAEVSFNRINDILGQEVEEDGEILINHIDSIRLENICFSYDDRALYNNFSYVFEKGKIYSLSGNNGCGKSTLLLLILGLLKPQTGTVYYNNININQLNMNSIRKSLIAYSEQEPLLLNKTIRQNILMSDERNDEITEEYINYMNLEILKDKIPGGLDIIYNEQQNSLSGGEKQKISQVRAFIKNADVLILDEPTSALDSKSKHDLRLLLKSKFCDKIIIVVTHDSDIADVADYVLSLRKEVL